MAWSKIPFPKNWKAIRKRVLIRDNYECRGSDWNGDVYLPCPQIATDVDHIHGRITNRLSNLQSLCRYHHRLKNGYDLNKKLKRSSQRLDREEVHPFYVQ